MQKTIVLSEQSPVSIDTDKWPSIAEAHDHDSEHECQDNTRWGIVVREELGGCRRIVSCYRIEGPGGQCATFRPVRGGYLLKRIALDFPELPSWERDRNWEAETIRAIRRCAGLIDDAELGARCIGTLPAVQL